MARSTYSGLVATPGMAPGFPAGTPSSLVVPDAVAPEDTVPPAPAADTAAVLLVVSAAPPLVHAANIRADAATVPPRNLRRSMICLPSSGARTRAHGDHREAAGTFLWVQVASS